MHASQAGSADATSDDRFLFATATVNKQIHMYRSNMCAGKHVQTTHHSLKPALDTGGSLLQLRGIAAGLALPPAAQTAWKT